MNINLAAGNSGYSTVDLILLLLGLKRVKGKSYSNVGTPPNENGATSGADFYLNNKKSVPLTFNLNFFSNKPWDTVKTTPFTDWLIANIIFNDAKLDSDFTAVPLSDKITQSFDLISSNILPKDTVNKKYLNTYTNYFKADKTTINSGNTRSYKSGIALAYGFVNKKLVIGFGMHRSITMIDGTNNTNTLTVSFESFIPCITVETTPKINIKPVTQAGMSGSTESTSIQTGISLTSNNLAIFNSQDGYLKNKTGIRFSSLTPITGGDSLTNLTLGDTIYGIDTLDTEQWASIKYKDIDAAKAAKYESFFQSKDAWSGTDYKTKIDKILKALTKMDSTLSDVKGLLGELYKSPFSPILPYDTDHTKLNTFGHFDTAKKLINNLKTSQGSWKEAVKESFKKPNAAPATSDYNDKFKTTYPGNPPITVTETAAVTGKLFPDKGTVSVAKFLGTELGIIKLRTTPPDTYEPADTFDPTAIKDGFINIIDGFPLLVKMGGGIKSGIGLKIGIFNLLKLAHANKGNITGDDLNKQLLSTPTSKLITLATRTDEKTATKKYLGLRAQYNGIVLKRPNKADIEGKTQKGSSSMINPYEIQFQMGKWLSPDNDQDNWYSRLLCQKFGWKAVKGAGQPGLGIYPFSNDTATGGNFEMDWRFGIVSAGLDIYGITERGLINIANDRFKISGVEVRGLFSADVGLNPKHKTDPAFTWGFAVLLSGVSLDLSGGKKKEGLEGNMQQNLSANFDKETGQKLPNSTDKDDEKKDAADIKAANARYITRLSKKVNSFFSLELGYLHSSDGKGIFDFQLYDGEGKRGKIAWLPMERKLGPFYIHAFGVGFSGMELQKPKLTLVMTGGLKFAKFELGLIGAGVSFPLSDPTDLTPVIMGLDMAVNLGSFKMMAGFMKYVIDPGLDTELTQYMGEVRIETPAVMIAGMGAYGKYKDGDVTLFLYAAMSAKNGAGIGNAVVKITGFALSFGVNRKVVPPAFDKVNEFSMVKLVMGEPPATGVTMDEVADKSLDPAKLLTSMTTEVVAAKDHYFGAIGLQFTLVNFIDCFALGILQFGPKDVEIILLGLGRLELPKGGSGLAYVELGLKADVHPSAKSFMFSMGLTNNSWVFKRDIHLTGGFAVASWLAGPHKGDYVYTMGGYHPNFTVPGHYPTVPRLGFNWSLSNCLAAKGSMYYAVVPGAFMAGMRLEANFHAGNISAHFDAHADMLMKVAPLKYDASIGIHISVDVDLLFHLKFSAGIDLHIWGPSFGGRADINTGFKFSITFGSQPSSNQDKIGAWEQFGRGFVDQLTTNGEKANANESTTTGKWTVPDATKTIVPGPSICQLQLKKGSLAGQGGKMKSSTSANTAKTRAPWFVRGDELVMAVSTTIPVKQLHVGKLATDYQQLPLVTSSLIGTARSLKTGIALEATPSGKNESYPDTLGIIPMGITDLPTSDLKITIVNDEEEDANLKNWNNWKIETDTSHMPAAIWGTDTSKPIVSNANKLVEDCIMGAKTISPPKGGSSINKKGFSIISTVFTESDVLTPQVIQQPVKTISDSNIIIDKLQNYNTKVNQSASVFNSLNKLGILVIKSEMIEKYKGTAYPTKADNPWNTLGVTQTMWSIHDGPPLPDATATNPSIWDKHWSELSPIELEAATSLGFDFFSWDERFSLANAQNMQAKKAKPSLGQLYADPLIRN